MSSLPTFTASCVAPDTAGIPYLFGVASSGRLEAHKIDLSNSLAPTSTLVSTATNPTKWSTQSSQLGCYHYAGDAPSTNSRIHILQFGATNLQVYFNPTNGTWAIPVESAIEAGLSYTSPRLYSLAGSTNGWNWFVARTANAAASWRGIRAGAKIDTGPQDLMPGSSAPICTVGAIAQDIPNYGNGFFFSFDQSGSAGTVYRATGNKRPDLNLTATEAMLTLSKPSAVNMNNNTLTQDAIPVTAGFAAFIVDKTPSGTIAILSIDPRSADYMLMQAPVKGSSPLFLPGQSVASLNSKIIVYGGESTTGPSNAIHVFDIISGSWSGPLLVDPSQNEEQATGLNPAIIGGAAACFVVLLVIIIGIIYKRRRSTKQSISRGSTPVENDTHRHSKELMIHMMKMDDKKGAKTPRPLPRNPSTILPQSQRGGGADSTETLSEAMDPMMSKAFPYPPTPKQSDRQQHNHYPIASLSESTRQTKQQQRRAPSRQPSAYSVFSDGSASHISLFPAQSGIYLVDSPSLIPPTPIVPSAYATAPLQYPQVAYNASSTPMTGERLTRKGSTYKVTVPNDYDDRQPRHHDMAASRSSIDLPSGSSWSGQSDSRQAPPPSTHNQSSQSQHPYSSGDRSPSSAERPQARRQQSSSRSLHSASPAQSNLDIPQSPKSITYSQTHSQPSTPRPRRKEADIPTVPDATLTDSVPPNHGLGQLSPPSSKKMSSRNEYRDSGSYKVEYQIPSSDSVPPNHGLGSLSPPLTKKMNDRHDYRDSRAYIILTTSSRCHRDQGLDKDRDCRLKKRP
ncbi:hypothetical protein BGZ94_008141 [Podila epigama]|nr:hypothetical protein BGZ94_008141 [Podila epigama]